MTRDHRHIPFPLDTITGITAAMRRPTQPLSSQRSALEAEPAAASIRSGWDV
jgi:hypothetical protein